MSNYDMVTRESSSLSSDLSSLIFNPWSLISDLCPTRWRQCTACASRGLGASYNIGILLGRPIQLQLKLGAISCSRRFAFHNPHKIRWIEYISDYLYPASVKKIAGSVPLEVFIGSALELHNYSKYLHLFGVIDSSSAVVAQTTSISYYQMVICSETIVDLWSLIFNLFFQARSWRRCTTRASLSARSWARRGIGTRPMSGCRWAY